jgi:hypothetical protein
VRRNPKKVSRDGGLPAILWSTASHFLGAKLTVGTTIASIQNEKKIRIICMRLRVIGV